MPLPLLPTACCAAADTAAPAQPSVAFSRPLPSRLRASHLVFAFPRLKKYGRRNREPVPTSFDEEDEDDMEEEVDEDIFLKNRPKPAGFGVGKTYTTDIEERLLQEMGLGGAGRKSEPSTAKSLKETGADASTEEVYEEADFYGEEEEDHFDNCTNQDASTEEVYEEADFYGEEEDHFDNCTNQDLGKYGVHVRMRNLPKKKNIHKDLNLAFKGFPGLVTINPANSGTKKTRDPICKGFAFLKLESLEAATRFIEVYSSKAVSFGKVEKPIKCCIVEGHSSTDPSNQASDGHVPGPSKLQCLVAAR